MTAGPLPPKIFMKMECSMNKPVKRRTEIPETLSTVLNEGKPLARGILAALLDAQIIFREPGLAAKDLEPLRAIFYPEEDPEQTIRRLLALGLIRTGENARLTIPEEIKLPMGREMENFWRIEEVRLPSKTLSFGNLIDEFEAYYRDECGVDPEPEAEAFPLWGGKGIKLSERSHLVLIRPYPLLIRPHENIFILLLSRFPEAGGRTLADLFSANSALRQRLALFDLEGGQKMNLTKSGVFVFFERFLMRVHGLRLAPSGELTQSLVDNGLLSFDKG